MAPPHQHLGERSAFDLLEEALHLLRQAPAGTWAAYAIGALPFALGLLFFWADMSISPHAPRHQLTASLAMAVLFLWLKAWQTLFCRRLMERWACLAPKPWSLRRAGGLLLQQAAWQPTGFLGLPAAFLVALPFAWVFAFYQNLCVLADGHQPSLRAAARQAWECACIWPRQNHVLLAVLAGLAAAVMVNWIGAFLLVPYLLKAWLGVETLFTRSSDAYLNTTFFALIAVLTWLAVDPLIKAAYTLRCFYAQARASGEDLKAGLRRLQTSLLPILPLLVLLLAPGPALAAESTASAAAPLPTVALDRSIDQVLQQPEFLWRLPKEKVPPAERELPLVEAFFQELGQTLKDWVEGVVMIFDKLDRWLENLFGKRRPPGLAPDTSPLASDWLSPLRVIFILLLVFILALTVRFILRWRRQRREMVLTTPADGPASTPVPDLTKDDLSPNELAEDQWQHMAREMAARGEWRLALRALYLCALATLASRELIAIARGKSNRDYLRELNRRAHSFPGLLDRFHAAVWDFERVWYGRHAATAELYRQYEERLEHLRAL